MKPVTEVIQDGNYFISPGYEFVEPRSFDPDIAAIFRRNFRIQVAPRAEGDERMLQHRKQQQRRRHNKASAKARASQRR